MELIYRILIAWLSVSGLLIAISWLRFKYTRHHWTWKFWINNDFCGAVGLGLLYMGLALIALWLIVWLGMWWFQ